MSLKNSNILFCMAFFFQKKTVHVAHPKMRELDTTTCRATPFFTARYLEKAACFTGGMELLTLKRGVISGGFCLAVARFIQIPNAETPNNTGGHRVRTHASHNHITSIQPPFHPWFFLALALVTNRLSCSKGHFKTHHFQYKSWINLLY